MDIASFYDRFGALVSSGLYLASAAILHLLFFVVHRLVHKKLSRTHKLWDDAISAAVYTPVRIAIWVTAAFLIVRAFHLEYELAFFQLVKLVYALLLLAIVVVFFIAIARHVERNVAKSEKRKLDLMMVKALSRLYYLFVVSIAGLFALRILGIPLSAVIAFGGIGGLAIGFASKDFLSNLFGGLMIFIGRPFSIGEVISSPDKEILGTVEDITWRQVKINTFENRPIYVPNSLFSTIVIENITRMKLRRILFDLSLRYDDMNVAKKIAQEIHEHIEKNKAMAKKMVHYARVVGFADAWVTLRVCCYPDTKDFFKMMEIQEDLLLECAHIIDKNGAQIAFPTQTVELVSKTELG